MSTPTRRSRSAGHTDRSPALAGGLFLVGAVGLAWFLATVLETSQLTTIFCSDVLKRNLVQLLGGELSVIDGRLQATVPLPLLMLLTSATGLLIAGVHALRHTRSDREKIWDASLNALQQFGTVALLPTGWAIAWTISALNSWMGPLSTLASLADMIAAVTLAGILAILVGGFLVGEQTRRGEVRRSSARIVLAGLILTSTLVWTALNWGLWFNLQIPHGDSAMYEEHLWNLEHGKGFRSYLDQGLFLGEHIQVIHVLLIPLHLLWPSHMLLELCESTALSLAAWPVYLLARHFGARRGAALSLAAAYLAYVPVHYLDIAIDLKTFRPISFGVPLLLWAIERMERRRWGQMTWLLLLTLACKEDFAIAIAPIGTWLAVTSFLNRQQPPNERRIDVIVGLVLAASVTLYLAVTVKFIIPWFRDGATVHYARYFANFGETPTEIVWNMLTRPGLLWSEFVTLGTIAYFLQLVVPLAGLPLWSPARLLTAAPLFLLLCLNELAQQPPGPVHHFHAPIVPILLWAAAASLGRRDQWLTSDGGSATEKAPGPSLTRWIPSGTFAICCALATSFVLSQGPLGLKFWDAGRGTYWRRLYLPDERARMFEHIEKMIPQSARVASTDFVHPRFTHHERSYDYSHYPRRVADYEDRVPHDTDYIVIDTRHRYSEVSQPSDLRELKREPEKWELLPDETNGYFIVLKRREPVQED